MEDGLRFMPEGSGKFEVAGHAGTERRRWWSGRCGTDCFGHLKAGAHCGEAAPAPVGDDADRHTHILTEPRFGYRREQGGGQEQETESSDPSVWAEPRRRRRPSGLAMIVGWWALGSLSEPPATSRRRFLYLGDTLSLRWSRVRQTDWFLVERDR